MSSWPPFDSLPIGGAVVSLFPFADPSTVTTETELLPLASLGPRYEDLVFTIRNHSETDPIAVYVDRSESGIVKNLSREILIVPPGLEGQLVFREVLSNFWGLSVAGDPSNANPACDVSWMLIGRRRAVFV